MVKKKEKKSFTFISKPTEKDYSKAYKKSGDASINKEIEKIYESKEKKYVKQQAQIATGERDSKTKSTVRKVASTIAKGFNQKMLRKPSAKMPSHSGQKVILQMAKEQGALVRDVPNPYADPVQDNRSLYFRESFTYEKRKRFGGFI